MSSLQQPAVLARSLGAVSAVLVLIYLAQLPLLLLSLNLASPQGVLQLAGALSRNAALPLLAVTLLHLALGLVPENGSLQRRALRVRHACALVTLCFLLLLPLQSWALLRSGNVGASDLQRRQLLLKERFRRLREVARTADSLPELQDSLRQLEGPPLPFAMPGTPFPAIRQRLLLALERSEPYVQERLVRRWRQDHGVKAVFDALNAMLPTLIYALGFAVFAQPPWSGRTLLEAWHQRRQPGGGAVPETVPASQPPAPRPRSLSDWEIGQYIEQLAEESESDHTGNAGPPASG